MSNPTDSHRAKVRSSPVASSLMQPSRREALAGIGAVGMSTLLPSLSKAQAGPSRGGVFHMALTHSNTAADTMDPRRATFSTDRTRLAAVANTLVRYSQSLKPEPELAEEWEALEGGRVWNFKIRQGVTFHNGKTLDSEDVVYSLNLHRPPNDSVVKSYFAAVESIEADGLQRVRITLKHPNADFPLYLGDINTIIVPAGFTSFDQVIGTGPFVLVNFKPGGRTAALRNQNYWKQGLPYVDRVEILGIPDTQARLNALLSGDVDFITRVDSRQVGLIEKSNVARVAASKSGWHMNMVMVCNMPPFKDNVDLRLALKFAVDREGMLRDVRRGLGQVGNDHPLSPADPYYCADIPQRKFDPDRAKFHFQRANISEPIVLRTSPAVGGDAPDMAVHLQQSAARCGIKVEVLRMPADGYYTNVWMKTPFHFSSYQPRPTADLILTLVHASNATWNETKFISPRIDQLLGEGRQTLDEARRKEIYCEVQTILHEQGGAITPMFLDFIEGHSARLQGYQPHPGGEAAAYRLAESVWVKS